MTLVELANEYHKNCKGLLTSTESSAYWSLVIIWNGISRPDWFNVSRQEWMSWSGIKSKDTIDKARRNLEKKGLISSVSCGRTNPRRFHLEKPPTSLMVSLDNKEDKNKTRLTTSLTRPIDSLDTRPTISLVEKLDQSLAQHKANEQPRLDQSLATSQSTELYRDIESSSDINTNLDSKTSPEEKNPTTTIPKKVLDFYQQEIRPVCSPYELERLEDIVTRYGEEHVLAAIKRSVVRNKRQLGYVEGILKRWEITGIDEEGENKHGQRHRDYGRPYTQPDPEAERNKWREEAKRFGYK